jgi:hypothetical protein
VCVIKSCLAGSYDANKDPKDGCEASCGPTNGGMEICDGIDNDCDGKIDELDSENNRTMDDKLVYVAAPTNVTIFAYEASRVDSTDKFGGFNSDRRPCSIPGRLPWANVTKEEARDACKALGGAWRLCTKDEWVAACSNRGANAFPYGAVYDPLRCNGADYRPQTPGVVATGSAAMCVADLSAAGDDQIMDMSGNVREWVQIAAGTEDYEMRGGPTT